MTSHRFALPLLTLTLGLAACGDGAADPPSDFIPCGLDQLRLEGDIDGTPVTLTQPTAGSGFSQFDKGEFRVDDLFVADPTRTYLTIDWTPTLLDGQTSTNVTATLVVPAEPAAAAFAGQTFCAGAGSSVRVPRASENVADLQFNLTSLTGGAGCTVAHTGTLRGCWRPDWNDAGAH